MSKQEIGLNGELVDSGYAEIGTALSIFIEHHVRNKYKACVIGTIYRIEIDSAEMLVVMEENDKYDGFLYWVTM